jgi:hypothetical protein
MNADKARDVAGTRASGTRAAIVETCSRRYSWSGHYPWACSFSRRFRGMLPIPLSRSKMTHWLARFVVHSWHRSAPLPFANRLCPTIRATPCCPRKPLFAHTLAPPIVILPRVRLLGQPQRRSMRSSNAWPSRPRRQRVAPSSPLRNGTGHFIGLGVVRARVDAPESRPVIQRGVDSAMVVFDNDLPCSSFTVPA